MCLEFKYPFDSNKEVEVVPMCRYLSAFSRLLFKLWHEQPNLLHKVAMSRTQLPDAITIRLKDAILKFKSNILVSKLNIFAVN